MAKLKSDSICKEDLIEYLKSHSDFSFELSVLKTLRENGIECEHGGHYEDPVTNKSREFDIRAIKTIGNTRVRMAIECKNIRNNFPILICCTSRNVKESYHEVAILHEAASQKLSISLGTSRAKIFKIDDENSLYKINDPVGKSTVQVGRSTDNTISANDSELYEKWGQCVSSAADLVQRTYWDGGESDGLYLSAVFPFVVVPNGRLWAVVYDENGGMLDDPSPTDRVSCYIGKDYDMGGELTSATLSLSHVEIVTVDGLSNFISTYLKDEQAIAKIFSKESLRKKMLSNQKNSP